LPIKAKREKKRRKTNSKHPQQERKPQEKRYCKRKFASYGKKRDIAIPPNTNVSPV
jgi:hypothetical protein